MHLTSLDVRCVRNIRQVQIRPLPGINQFIGANGAGKTSLLEAISVLSTGRSFRQGSVASIVSTGEENIVVSGEIFDPRLDLHSRIGIQRSKDSITAKLNGEKISRLSMLAQALPLLVVSARAHELVEGGPSGRRSFLDWSVFHVEHQSTELFRRYRNALSQRNAALKAGMELTLVNSWNTELSQTAALIDDYRSKAFAYFISTFKRVSKQLEIGVIPQFNYRRGWPRELDLAKSLEKNLDQCRRYKTTSVGIHRADIRISVGSDEARYVLSRGQQKLIAVTCFLVQGEMFRESTGRPPILLLDDITSELDVAARIRVVHFLQYLEAQVFMTAVEPVLDDSKNGTAMFHVERGSVGKVI